MSLAGEVLCPCVHCACFRRHWKFVQKYGECADSRTCADAIKATANEHGEARIVVVGSNGYKIVSKFDYEACTSGVPHEGKWMLGIMFTAWYRYLNSKLGTLYFTMELNRRLKEEGVENVFVNTLHPGKCSCCKPHSMVVKLLAV